MSIQKSRGYSWENETVKWYNKIGRAKRLGQPHQPDIIAIDTQNRISVIECKSTIRDVVYIQKAQLDMLRDWSDFLWGSHIIICVKFMKNTKHKTKKICLEIHDIYNTEKNIAIYYNKKIKNCEGIIFEM